MWSVVLRSVDFALYLQLSQGLGAFINCYLFSCILFGMAKKLIEKAKIRS